MIDGKVEKVDKPSIRKLMFLNTCYNEETGEWDIPCTCGRVHNLNRKMIFVINMHNLKCKCGEPIIPYNK